VQFDQRGCGRSTPTGELDGNTTWDLIADAERIREYLGIERWIVSGGSWGCTLAILYAERHPGRTRGLVLRGVFLGEAVEIEWIGRRSRMIRPEAWASLAAELGMEPDQNCYDAMDAVLGPDRELGTRIAVAFNRYEATCASIEPDLEQIESSLDPDACYTTTRIGQHYVTHRFFIDEGQCLRDLCRIRHLPGIVISGRYDLVCPPDAAFRLHRAWPRSEWIVAPRAGHSAGEQEILEALRRAYTRVAERVMVQGR